MGFFQNAMCRTMIGNLIILNRTVLKLSDVVRPVSRWAAEIRGGSESECLSMTRNHRATESQALQTRRSAWHVILDNVVHGNRTCAIQGDYLHLHCFSSFRTSYSTLTPMERGAHGLGVAGETGGTG